MKKTLLFLTALILSSGYYAKAQFSGNGDESNPFIIANATDLAALATNVNSGTDYSGKHFSLTADINLSGVANWTPVGYSTDGTETGHSFKGSFHGGGHSITGLTATGTAYVGLFGAISGATIENLYVINANISGTGDKKGVLVAIAFAGSVINNCYVSGTVSGAGNNGGIAGESWASVSNCYSDVNISGQATLGSLIGYHRNDAAITNSYSTGNVSGTLHIGGVAGYGRYGGSVSYCYSTGNISGTGGTDEGVGGIMGTIRDNTYTWTVQNNIAINGFVNASTTTTVANRIMGRNRATATALNNNYALESTTVNGATVTGGTISNTNGANKTADDFRSISFFNTGSNWASAAWSIDANVNFSKAWTIWEGKSYPYLQIQSAPVASVTPQANGVIGYELRNPAASVVITAANGDVLKTETSVAAGSQTAGIPGLTHGTVFFTVYETDKMPSYPVKAVYNYFEATGDGSAETPYIINNVTALSLLASDVNSGVSYSGKHFSLTADIDLSGIANWTPIGYGTDGNHSFKGYFHGNGYTVSNLTATGAADVGLFGSISGATIEDLYVINANISGTGQRKAALVGLALAGSVITNCYVSGTVSGNMNNGGVVGELWATVSNCYSAVNVSGNNTQGSLVGYFRDNASITNSYSTGDVTGDNHLGGVVGYGRYGNSVSYCYSTGNISGQGASNEGIGGIIGTVRDNNTWTVKNNVAINGSITSATATVTNRILGVNRDVSSSFLNNNYALESIIVNGNTVTGGTVANNNGANKTAGDFRSITLFNTASNWENAAWSIDANVNSSKSWTIWEGKSYPYLQTQSAPAATITPYPGGIIEYELRNNAASVVITDEDGTVLKMETSVTAGSKTVNIPGLTNNLTVIFTVYETGKMPSYPVKASYSYLEIAANDETASSAYAGGDIVFKSTGSSTGQLVIPSGTMNVTGKVHVQKTFTTETWYPVGFPFAIDKIHGDFQENPKLYIYNPDGSQWGDFWVKYYAGDSESFEYTPGIEAGTGYILQFPDDFDGVEVTFSSSAAPAPVLENLTENDLSFTTGTYTLLANPSVNNLEIGNVSGNRYYIYNRTANNFALLALGATATIKPFESFVAVKGIEESLLKSALNIEEVSTPTGIQPADDLKDPVIKTQYYTLEGMETAQLQNHGMYIVKKTRASHKVETSKIIYQKEK